MVLLVQPSPGWLDGFGVEGVLPLFAVMIAQLSELVVLPVPSSLGSLTVQTTAATALGPLSASATATAKRWGTNERGAFMGQTLGIR